MKYAITVMVALMLTGCWTLSIHPLYTDKDLVQDPMLEGKWYPADSRDVIWIFEHDEGGRYQLSIIEEGVKEQLENMENDGSRLMLTVDPIRDCRLIVHLFKLGDDLFLDMFPAYPEEVNEIFAFHLIPAHTFARVSIQGNVLMLSFFDMAWLEKSLSEGKIEIKHEKSDDMIVLTAGTEELQGFVLDHLDEAFEDAEEMHRLE